MLFGHGSLIHHVIEGQNTLQTHDHNALPHTGLGAAHVLFQCKCSANVNMPTSIYYYFAPLSGRRTPTDAYRRVHLEPYA